MFTQLPLRLIILSLLVSSGFSSAQDTATYPDQEQNKTGYRVSLFSAWKGPTLYYKGKKEEYHPLEAYKMSYTKPLPYERGKPIIFYTKIENTGEEPVYQPYLRTALPVQVIEPLIVLYWSQKSQKGYSQVLEFSPRRFPYGSYQFVNLGSTNIVGYIKEKTHRFQCAPLKSTISNKSAKNGEVIPIEMVTKNGAETVLVYSSVVKHRNQKRMIFFLYPEKSQTGRLVYKVDLLEDYSQEGS